MPECWCRKSSKSGIGICTGIQLGQSSIRVSPVPHWVGTRFAWVTPGALRATRWPGIAHTMLNILTLNLTYADALQQVCPATTLQSSNLSQHNVIYTHKDLYVTKDPYVTNMVSFETNFDSIQPQLKPKQISALSENKTCASSVSLISRYSEFRYFV
jgi:hypothetical protein